MAKLTSAHDHCVFFSTLPASTFTPITHLSPSQSLFVSETPPPEYSPAPQGVQQQGDHQGQGDHECFQMMEVKPPNYLIPSVVTILFCCGCIFGLFALFTGIKVINLSIMTTLGPEVVQYTEEFGILKLVHYSWMAHIT